MLLLIFSTGLLPASPAHAEKRVPAVTMMVTPDTLLVGDRIHCTIQITNPDQEVASVVWGDGVDSLSVRTFELVSSKHISSSLLHGQSREKFELELAAFGTGQQFLPPFTVALHDSKGNITKKIVYKPSTTVFVRALTDSTMRDLRPVKPPLKPPIPLLLIMPLILGVFGVGGLVLLLLFMLKRVVRKSAEKVDSGQVAQRKLRKLGSNLSAGMPPHECYEELSNIMRSFLESHYRIRALEAVTQEIERDLKKLGVAGFESIMNLLKQADLVKFADIRPDVEESRQSLHKASEVIRSTRYFRPPDQPVQAEEPQ